MHPSYKNYLLLALLALLAQSGFSQFSFTNQSQLLTPQEHFSGVAIAVLDMNGDGYDDIVRMEQGYQLNIQFQKADGSFFNQNVESVSNQSQWGMCAADVDNNGYADVLTGGFYDGIKIISANNIGSEYSMENITNPSTFVQGVNFADINNDGWLDAFVCHDDGAARIFLNDGQGGLVYAPNAIDLATTPVSDNSGNYGSEWVDIDNDGDLDLYIAKCRQGVNDPTDGRRINQLFLNNGDGTYSQDLTNTSGLRIGAQSWTADFGDIDNDGDFDVFITNHDVSSQILINDGAGHFTDITPFSGITSIINGTPIQGIFRDFDNDGYNDILVAGGSTHIIHNNGNNTFTEVAGVFDDDIMESYAVGDLNHDGFVDIYGGYGNIYTTPSNTPDKLWINGGNNNHFFGMNLIGVQSNRSAIGARITLYSALGTQIRELRSGDSYGIMNSLQMQFGMGQVTQIDSVIVRWPSGKIDRLYNPEVDQYLTLQEGGCFPPPAPLVVANGATTICSGQSVTLSTSTPYNFYTWSDGSTSAELVVTQAGQYKVSVAQDEGCASISNTIEVIVDPVEIPTISIDGDTIICAGKSVTLTCSPANGYAWSNGATTQSIEATEAGTYFVNAQGLCQVFPSGTVHVTVLSAPAPVAENDTVFIGNPATLSAQGANVIWYGGPNDQIGLATGNEYTTGILTENDTFWVSNLQIYDSPNQSVGMIDHMGTTLSGNQFNGKMFFDVYKAVRLKSVKVYTAKAGTRRIDLYNGNGDLLQFKEVAIPVGTTVIDLDFNLPVGNDLYLTTDQGTNQTNLGSVSPQLRRSDQGVMYPYTLPEVLSITGNNLASDRYYYFYDWVIDFYEYNCESERIPVIVYVKVLSAANEPAWARNLQMAPNPTGSDLNIRLQTETDGQAQLRWYNAQGSLLRTQNKTMNAGANAWTENLSTLPAGVYLLEVATEQGSVRRKIVKE